MQVTLDGAGSARWHPDGTRIHVSTQDGLVEIPVASGAGGRLELGAPRLLFAFRELRITARLGFSHAPDAQGFILARNKIGSGTDAQATVVLVEDWTLLLGGS